MSNAFDIANEIALGLQGRHHAWEFVRRFSAAWLTPLREGDGYGDAELVAAEEHMGFGFPAALREAYLLFGRRDDLCRTMNHMLEPDGLYLYEDDGLLLYHAENQGCWERYIRLSDLHMEDPPTVSTSDCGHAEHAASAACTERLSNALIEMVLDESLSSAGGLTAFGRACEPDGAERLGLHGELLGEDVREVERLFVRLGASQLPGNGSACDLRRGWYAGDDLIVRIDHYRSLSAEQETRRSWWHRPGSRAEISVRARTPEVAERARRSLPAEWFHWS